MFVACSLYLHPDPGGRRGPSAGRDPTTALQVVQSFFGKRKETIREDIELLRSHNDAVERRRDEGDSLLKSFRIRSTASTIASGRRWRRASTRRCCCGPPSILRAN